MAGRSVTVVDKGRVEVRTCEVGDPGTGQVLVRAHKTLVSPGTERAGLLQLPNTKAKDKVPYVGGDCFAGVIEQVGPSVTGLQAGVRVTGMLRHQELQVADAQRCVPVPDGVTAEQAAFTPLLQTCMQAVRKARLEIGTPVLVVGLGLIGQLTCKLVRLGGAMPLVGTDMSGVRRALAEPGCDAVLDPNDDAFGRRLTDLTGGTGPEVVIEATGVPEVINRAFQVCARMGRVVLLGSTRGETERVNFYRDVHKRGLTVYGAHCTAVPGHERQPHRWPERDDMRVGLDLLASGRVDVSDLITDRYPVDDAPAAYARLGEWDERLMGMILDWTA